MTFRLAASAFSVLVFAPLVRDIFIALNELLDLLTCSIDPRLFTPASCVPLPLQFLSACEGTGERITPTDEFFKTVPVLVAGAECEGVGQMVPHSSSISDSQLIR